MPGHEPLTLIEKVRPERMMKHLDQLAQIGRTIRGGITRLAFTQEDRLARALVIDWMHQAGLEVRTSPIGNIFGRLGSPELDLPVVMTGSHIDTVIDGGRFDGALGVVAAIEVAHVLNENSVSLSRPLEVVCFVMEESSRFSTGYAFGSKVMTGQIIDDETLLAQDRTGQTLAEAIYAMRSRELGIEQALMPSDSVETAKTYIGGSRYPPQRIQTFIELHVEQGPILHTLGKPIGAVTAIAAPTRLAVTLLGQQNHSGTTPMRLRKDALAAAAEAILAVERICRSSEGVVGTVGRVEVAPNAVNVIPGKVWMVIDVRSVSAGAKADAADAIRAEIGRIATVRDVAYQLDTITDETPQPLSDKIVSLIEKNCQAMGIECHRLASGAGHDAAQLAQTVADTGMIFVPSRDGISHDPQEWTDKRDILTGAQVLLLTLLDLTRQ
ncbi:MAG: Zn-dependent hydrolase [Anaerolineae bacterium]|nr:MAG: Zn-dependent hydrolase [Anaerolineae bacterium]